MSLESILPTGVPAPAGPYSHATVWSDLIFISGQGPVHPETGSFSRDNFSAQAAQALTNLETVLNTAGGGLETVLKTHVYLTDLTHFDVMNDLYGKVFHSESLPARTTVGVASLPGGIAIEIDAIAFRRRDGR